MARPARPDGPARLGSPRSRSPRRAATPDQALAPGDHLALTCFAAGAMGSELPDAAFYRQSGLHGGLAYTPESLRRIFSGLTETELRRMRDEPPESPHFGERLLTGREPLRPSVAAQTQGFTAPDRANIEETTHRFTTAYEVLDLLGRSAELPLMPEVRADVERHTEQGTLLAEDALARVWRPPVSPPSQRWRRRS